MRGFGLVSWLVWMSIVICFGMFDVVGVHSIVAASVSYAMVVIVVVLVW